MGRTLGRPHALDSLRSALGCRNCGAHYALAAIHACAASFGPLELGYDEAVVVSVTRTQIGSGPDNLWRYVGFLPVGQDPDARVSLNPGLTPLIHAPGLAGYSA